MKKTILFLLTIAGFLFMAFTTSDLPVMPQDEQKPDIGAPEKVMAVLERSCFDCHTAGSKNEKARLKLNFSNWNEYDAAKKVSKLDEICEVVKSGDMPPEKYLANKPEAKLTQEEADLICKWVEEASTKLMGNE